MVDRIAGERGMSRARWLGMVVEQCVAVITQQGEQYVRDPQGSSGSGAEADE